MAANKLEYYQTFAQRETIDAIDRKLDARFKDLKSDLGSEIHLLSTRLDRIIARFGSEPRSRNG